MLHSCCKELPANLLTLLFIALLGPNAFALAANETVLYGFAHGAQWFQPHCEPTAKDNRGARRHSGATIRFSCS